ncbi:hypothetical protein B7463_g9221, partial [Scytalidium lignicola]
MRFLSSLIPSLLLLGAGVAQAASAWTFDEATISVQSKGAGNGFKDKLSTKPPLAKSVSLGTADTLKILLTAKDGSKAARPHQAFLMLKDQGSGLETTFPFSMKESGKGKVEVVGAPKDLPIQFAAASKPLKATLILASFGSSTPFGSHVFDLDVKTDPALGSKSSEKPLRYGKLAEIHHIFRADPTSPPKIISIFFALAVLGTLPILLGGWAYLGANLSHATKAMSTAPISHSLFFGSIVSMEFVFFLYYSTWNLFQTLPVAGVIGLVAYVSGSKALSEVRGRRLAVRFVEREEGGTPGEVPPAGPLLDYRYLPRAAQ